MAFMNFRYKLQTSIDLPQGLKKTWLSYSILRLDCVLNACW